jgi:hypothetical protein
MNSKSSGKGLEGFLMGKGFYIVLFLCAAVIGLSAWMMTAGNETMEDLASSDVNLNNYRVETVLITPDVQAPKVEVMAIPEPTAEPVQGGCPVAIIPSLFTNRTAADVIAYYGTEGCSWNIVSYDSAATNPNNYQGVASYYRNTDNSATLIMFVRWQ